MLALWNRCLAFPFGSALFNWLLAWRVPYTGTIHPRVLRMERGEVHIAMRDRRRVRNHLHSIHAIAMMNLGEVATGLAVLSTLKADERAIITHLEIDFLKKARGTLVAKARFAGPEQPVLQSKNYDVEGLIYNESNDCVAKVKAHWFIGPAKASSQSASKAALQS